MTIDELLDMHDRRSYSTVPESDALTEEDALQEANLLDIRFDLSSSCLTVLVDLRLALQFRTANTAILVMRDVGHIEVTSPEPPKPHRFAPPIMSSNPKLDAGTFRFSLVCLRGWTLYATSSAAEFFVGDVPNLPEAQPNFPEDDDATVMAGMQSWNSNFAPGWATFIDPMPPL